MGFAIRVAFVGIVLGLVLGIRPSDYIPWLTTGWIVWGMMSSAITGMSLAMTQNRGLMLALPLPKEVFVLKVVVKELCLFLQNSTIVLLVLIFLRVPVTGAILLLIPGLAVMTIFLYGTGLIMAPLAARYKDLGPLISSMISVLFFVLPIMWKPERLQSETAHLLLGLNPFYHFLQIVRLPLIGEVPTLPNYLVATIGASVAFGAGMWVMALMRNKIVYWA